MTGRTEPGRTHNKRRPQKRTSFLKETIYLPVFSAYSEPWRRGAATRMICCYNTRMRRKASRGFCLRAIDSVGINGYNWFVKPCS